MSIAYKTPPESFVETLVDKSVVGWQVGEYHELHIFVENLRRLHVHFIRGKGQAIRREIFDLVDANSLDETSRTFIDGMNVEVCNPLLPLASYRPVVLL
jgi:hypothetical protein